MASKTEICNLALGHLGQSKRISNVDTQTTPEAAACKLFYDYALETILREIDWPFATKIADLAVVAENPTTTWGYAYRYPSDCIKIRRIPSALLTDTSETRIPFAESFDGSGNLIYCSEANAKLEYTSLVVSVTLYPSDFIMALSYFLASLIAPSVTTGDDFKLADRSLKLSQLWLGKAGANAQNEIQNEQEPDAESIRARL